MTRDSAATPGPLLATDLHVQATYRLTEALVESENRMRRRVELLSEVVFETDAGGQLVFLNPAWSRATGHDVTACLGQRLESFILEEDRPRFARLMACASEVPGNCKPQLRVTRRDGGVAWMEVSAARQGGGGVVGALHDVTVEKRAKDELAKLSLVASYTDNLVIITDHRGLTEWVNAAFVERTGYTLEDLIGRKPGEVLQGPDTNADTVRFIRRQLAKAESVRAELLNYTKSGEAYWVLVQITPIFGEDGRLERFVAIQSDTTRQHEAQEMLRAAKERAEAASIAKTQFLATISHEMRTPLNVILGSTDLALENDNDFASTQRHLHRINNNAEILLRLISDVLDLSKIEAGQIDLELIPFALRPCLQRALGPVSDRATAKGLEFALTCDARLPQDVVGDPDRLRQIVVNLAENAVKFTDTGSIRVLATPCEIGPTRQSGLELRVIDTGIGIAPGTQERIFERFEQGDSSTTRRKGGAGLGLNIVRSLVLAMGGTVGVQSALGQGSEFTVRLPLAAARAAAAPVEKVPNVWSGPLVDSAPNRRVLVAEDTDANFAILEVFLAKAGYTVERARDGREAVDLAARGFDAILMDIEMPEMDGLEATRRVRKHEIEHGLRPVPILALTAHAIQGYREQCLSAGCTGYLSKPVRRPALLEAVAAAISDSQAAQSTGTAATGSPKAAPALPDNIDPDLVPLIPEFLQYCQSERQRLIDAVGAADWTLAARLGHSLKGAAPAMGFDAIGQQGREIEAAAKAADGARIMRLLDDLAAYLDRLAASPV